MLFQANPKLEECIVELLAEHGQLSASELSAELQQRGYSFSRPAIFKELAKLLQHNTLSKVGTLYMLNQLWLQRFSDLAQQASQSASSSKVLGSLLPEPGARHSWKCNDLLSARSLWAQLVLVLLRNTESKLLFSWNPHPWFYLVRTAQQERLLATIDSLDCVMAKIVGGMRYLDTYCEQYWQNENFHYSFSKSPFESQRSRYISLVDDYVLRVDCTTAMSNRIEDLFETMDCAEKIDFARLYSLFTVRSPVRISVLHSPREARRLEALFRSVFPAL